MPRIEIVITRALLAALVVAGCTVKDPISTPVPTASVSVSAAASQVLVGGTLQLSAVPMSASNKQLTARSSQVTWTVSNTSVATVSASGLLTGVTAGQVTVNASQGGVTGTLLVSVANPAPVLTSISPSSASAGGAAFTLRVLGSNFVAASVVKWNGSDRTTTFVGAGELNAAITAADIAAAGTATVTVVSPGPGGGSSGGATFTVNAALPVATTQPADSITSTTARIWGKIVQDGKPYTAWFEWGTSPTLATYSSNTPGSGPDATCPGTTTCYWWVRLINAQPSTTYYYRFVAQNAAGTTRGAIMSFTTTAGGGGGGGGGVAPVISALTTTNVQINGCSDGSTAYDFRFNFTDADGDVAASGAYVTDVWSFPNGNSGTLTLTMLRSGTGSAGTISVGVCTRFGSNTSTSDTFTLRDVAGHVSNALTVVSPKPAGANSRPGQPAVRIAPVAVALPVAPPADGGGHRAQ